MKLYLSMMHQYIFLIVIDIVEALFQYTGTSVASHKDHYTILFATCTRTLIYT